MEKQEELQTCYEAIATFGTTKQIDIAIEEMAELTQALIKFKRGKQHNVEEEIADVEIMIEQLKIIFDADKYERFKHDKLCRLKEVLEDGKLKQNTGRKENIK